MLIHILRAAGLAALAFLGAATPALTHAQAITKIIVPFPAGGTADFVARLAADRLALELKAPVVVDNRVGANGNIGTEAVARAPADGLTLLLGSTPNLSINPSLYRKVRFDPIKDFVPIMQLALVPNVLVVNANVPASSVAELVAYAKANPGKLRFASGGNGSTGHLAIEMFDQQAGVKSLHVPYKGGPQAVTDLIGGQVDALFFTVPGVLPHVQSGRLKALAIASASGIDALPSVPTLAASGFPGFDASPWFGLLAPAGTPAPTVERIRRALARAWLDDDVRAKLSSQGAVPLQASADEYARILSTDLARWTAAVKRSGAAID